MPIEIRELVIRATVDQGNSRATSRNIAVQGGSGDQSSIDCMTKMEEIKKMMQEKNER